MCGIYGYVANDGPGLDRAALDRMEATLVHRGPDGRGRHVDDRAAIGMRRLAIIDLATGDQPIPNEDGSAWVVFNGEIYNYRELRARLVAAGHRFRSATDTEVLVHLWEEHRERCVEHLRGMFALAVWAPRERALFLARDRVGIKPLYWAETGDGFVFASEIRAIVASGAVPRALAPAAVGAYLRLGYVPDPLAIVPGVAKLAPGHTLLVRGGRAGAPRRYWDVGTFFRDEAPRADATPERVWSALADAVRAHTVSDVPVGAFLSGGVDSTSVVAAMVAVAEEPVKTFSVGFAEPGFDERPWARRVAEALGTEHHELLVTRNDLARLDDVLAAYDEPFADASAIPTFFVAELARRHVKVVLSGDGGDELFAGYDRYLVERRRRYAGVLGEYGLGAPLHALSRALPEGTPGKRYLRALGLPGTARYVESVSLFPPSALVDIAEPQIAAADGALDAAVAAGEGLDALSRMQDLDVRTYLPGDILTKLDRATMAHSLEARVPLLDHPLVELACRLPAHTRVSRNGGKRLLKRAVAPYIPAGVVERPKQGFGVPLHRWLAGRDAVFFRDRLGRGDRLAAVGVRPAAVERLLALWETRGRQEHCERLWALLVLDRSVDALLGPRSDAVPAVAAATAPAGSAE